MVLDRTLSRPKLARISEVMCVSSCEGSKAALVAMPTRSPLIPMRTELWRLPLSLPDLPHSIGKMVDLFSVTLCLIV